MYPFSPKGFFFFYMLNCQFYLNNSSKFRSLKLRYEDIKTSTQLTPCNFSSVGFRVITMSSLIKFLGLHSLEFNLTLLNCVWLTAGDLIDSSRSFLQVEPSVCILLVSEKRMYPPRLSVIHLGCSQVSGWSKSQWIKPKPILCACICECGVCFIYTQKKTPNTYFI